MTEEEQQELNDLLNYDENQSDSDNHSENDSDYEPQSDNESVYDASDENFTLNDVELEEFNRSVEDEPEQSADEPEQSADDDGAVEANRGQKYVGQGKGDKTVWWSMSSEDEKGRTELLNRGRMLSFVHCTRNFDEKKDAFMHIFPAAIMEQIVLETNRKAKKAQEANRHLQPPKLLYFFVVFR